MARSECFKEKDKNQIFAIVEKEVGFERLNAMICEQMRAWMIDTVERERVNDPDNLHLLHSVASSLYHQQGNYDKAERIYSECIERRKNSLGDSHPDTLLSMNNLGKVYSDSNKHEKAEALFVECLDKGGGALMDDHPDFLNVFDLDNVSFYKDALILLGFHESHQKADFLSFEPLYAAYYEEKKVLLGETYPDTLVSLNKL